MTRKNNFINEVDKFIGKKIHNLRLTMGLSRAQLAKGIGVTHQQLQKYENGINRISVGRLVLIAKVLSKNVSFFYEGVGVDDKEPFVNQHERLCIEVSRNFMKITKPEHQQAVNAIIRTLTKVA